VNSASKQPPSSRRREADGANLRRWLPAAAAVAVVAVVVGIGLAGRDGRSEPVFAGSDATSTSSSPTGDPALTATTVPVVVETQPAVPKTHLTSSLKNGSASDEVTTVQQRLKDLGFDPGPVDGKYGGTTRQAVWAFEKLILQIPRAEATGVVTDEMWQRMQDNLVISPLRPTGVGSTHVEVYVPQQVMAVFTDDKPVLVAHIATGEQDPDGSPAHWCETATYDTDANGNPLPEPVKKQECADAKTPGGIFKINRFAQGDHVSPLGGMFNPVYFNYGIAIHGAINVPLEPASHGCVRINMTLAKTFPDLVNKGDNVYVWAQDGKQPEQYSKNESLPSFNQPDPNASTTTSTTIAPTTTTIAATTTTKPVATTVPKTTTTTAPKGKPTTTLPAPVTTAAAPPSTDAPATTAAAP
jgi:peptidoglycan hydrolase-like protein with peptidoglycan-binding domain